MANKIAPRKYNRAMGLRMTKFWTGTKQRLYTSSEFSRSNFLTVRLDKLKVAVNDAVSQWSDDAEIEEPYADNSEPWRKRFSKHGMKRIYRIYKKMRAALQNFFQYLNAFGDKKLSRAEKFIMFTRLRRWDEMVLDDYRRKQETLQLFKFHKEQAQILKSRIIESLTAQKFCQYTTKNDRIYVKRKMQVSHIDVSAFAYTYHFKLPAPFGVNIFDIATDQTTNIIAASIGKKINILLDQFGLRLVIEIGSTLSIPNFVTYKEMIDKMPKKLPILSYPAGMSVNGSLTYRNIDSAPHVIIAGQSGGGKSNAQNVIICSLISRNSPQQLRCIFIDLKGGLEFSFYEGIPHLQPMEHGDWKNSGIVERSADVANALRWIMNECEHRQKIIKNAKCKDLNGFNRRKALQNRVPNLLVFFDEWAIVKKSKFGSEAESILSEIGNVGRSSGIHVVLSTQYPNAEILSPIIAVNFMQRLAFNMTSGGSQSVVGNWDAHNLSPAGRAILHTSQGNIPVQFPRITDGAIKTIVAGVKAGNVDITGMLAVDADELLNFALTNLGGKLERDTLFSQYKGKITAGQLGDLLRSMDNQVYEIQGTFYRVIPPAGVRARYMELDDADSDGRPDAVSSGIQHPTSEAAENAPKSAPEPVTRDEQEVTPYTCVSCGAQTSTNPCEYCGKYIEEK